jgi:hypothetical protein
MPLKTETREIGSLQVTTTQLPAMRALGLMPVLSGVLGPALANLVTVDRKADATSLAPTFAAMFGRLDAAALQSLARDLLAGSSAVINGKNVSLGDDSGINAAFSGSPFHLLQAMWFAVEINFIGPLRDGLGSVAAAPASP